MKRLAPTFAPEKVKAGIFRKFILEFAKLRILHQCGAYVRDCTKSIRVSSRDPVKFLLISERCEL
jgi:hypothetical protein